MKNFWILFVACVMLLVVGCGSDGDIGEDGQGESISVSQKHITVSSAQADYSINVISSCSWEATSECSWIQLHTRSGIAGNEPLFFLVEPNLEVKERKGTVVVRNTDFNHIAEFYVTQKAFEPILEVSTQTMHFPSEGETKEVLVTTNIDYDVVTNVDWLTVTKTSSGITVVAKASDTTKERSAEITLSNSEYNLTNRISVTQKAFKPILEVSTHTMHFSSEGETKEVLVTTNIDYIDYDVVTNVDWLTVTKTSSGITVVAEAQYTTKERSAEIIITLSYNQYIITRTIEVVQAAMSNNDCIIYYTTLNGEVVTPNTGAFGVAIKSNTYENGQGILIFDAPVTSIGEPAFSYCWSLKSITLPKSLTTIGDGAFSNCESLASITLPKSLTTIGDHAFSYCWSLKSITLPKSLTTIGDGAFYGCTSLASITIPEGVTTIGVYAFYGCTSLESITIPEGVTTIGVYAFSGCI